MRDLLPYVNRDTLRKVGQGMLFRAGYVSASDGVSLARAVLDMGDTDEHVLALDTVRAIAAFAKNLREPPSHVGVHDGLHHLHWESGAILASPTLETRWPDLNVTVDEAHAAASYIDGDRLAEIRDAVSTVVSMSASAKPVVTVGKDSVRTDEDLQRGEVFTFSLPEARFAGPQLNRVLSGALRAGFEGGDTPKVAFTADGFDGLLLGLRPA